MNKFITTLGCFFCLSISKFFGLNYGLDAKKEGNGKITRLHIFSERCSGSFYLLRLLRDNIFFHSADYSHKHFPPWFVLPLEKFKGPRHFYTFENSDDTLFVVLFRNPYAWLKSMHQNHHHTHSSLHHLSFSNFIRRRWILKDTDVVVVQERKLNPYLDRDPYTKRPFKNVMKLRTEKIRNMLMIKDKVKNIYFLNYEKVRDHPHEVVKEIADIFDLEPNAAFKSISYYKGDKTQGTYKPKKYDSISQTDLQFINLQLDADLEEMIGYNLIDNPCKMPNDLHSLKCRKGK